MQGVRRTIVPYICYAATTGQRVYLLRMCERQL